jgi:hypothetical protein
MCPPLDSSSQPGSPLRYYGASVYFLLKETVSRNWINTWKLLIFHFLQLILHFDFPSERSVLSLCFNWLVLATSHGHWPA